MQIYLSQLNAVPGVIGSLVCDAQGELLARQFPSLFDAEMLARVSKLVAGSGRGLDAATGNLRLIDLRFEDARVVVRPLSGGYLLFLCVPGANLQPLAVSASVAVPQIERRLAARRSPGARAVPNESRPTPAPLPPDPLTPAPALASLGPPPAPVPELYAIVQQIEAVVAQRRLDRFRVRGEIAIKAGFGLGHIDARTPNDPAKIAKLRAAVSAVLGVSM